MLFLSVFPIGWNIYLSLHDVRLVNLLREWPYVGFANVSALVHDAQFRGALTTSLAFVLGSAAGQLVLGFAVARLLAQRLPGSGAFRTLCILPWILSAVIAGFSWKWLYHDTFGLLNHLLRAMGLAAQNWLSSPSLALTSVTVANIWFGTPFTVLFQEAALASIDPTLYEAGQVDGASGWKLFRHITAPLLAPFWAINLVLVTMWTVNLFDLLLVMTHGGPLFSTTTASLYMYRSAFEFGLLSRGATVGLALLVINLGAAVVYLRVSERGAG